MHIFLVKGKRRTIQNSDQFKLLFGGKIFLAWPGFIKNKVKGYYFFSSLEPHFFKQKNSNRRYSNYISKQIGTRQHSDHSPNLMML